MVWSAVTVPYPVKENIEHFPHLLFLFRCSAALTIFQIPPNGRGDYFTDTQSMLIKKGKRCSGLFEGL